MHHQPPILVVSGSIHYDVVLQVPQLPGDNDRITPTAATLAPGGMGGNVAAAAARLGAMVRFGGWFPGNEDGVTLRADLEREGVDLRWAGAWPAGHAHRGTILVDDAGRRAILGTWPDRDSLERSPGQAPGVVQRLDGRGKGRWLEEMLGDRSLAIPTEAFDGPNVALAAPANFAPLLLPTVPEHVPVYLDLETGHLDDWSIAEIVHTLSRAKVLYGNQRNIQSLAQRLGAESGTDLAGHLDITIIETLNERGCCVHRAGQRNPIPGFAVATVDTTGAGDAFAAACTVALERGLPMLEAARFANAVAALSTRALGSRPGVPGLTEVQALLATARSGWEAPIQRDDRDPRDTVIAAGGTNAVPLAAQS